MFSALTSSIRLEAFSLNDDKGNGGSGKTKGVSADEYSESLGSRDNETLMGPLL